MNIVKIKDIIIPNECSFSDFFNKNLKGKYAYWVQMRYIFPLDSIDYITYIKYEQMDEVDFIKQDIINYIDLYNEECCMFNFSQIYIDHEETSLINDINEYKILNTHSTDSDIDLNKIRNFRSWLANEILLYNTTDTGEYLNNLSESQIHMLQFYKNDMYNEVVKQLNIFGSDSAYTLLENNTGCGCCATNISSLYNTSLITNSCDALNVYTKNVHNLMVQTFENISFWKNFNKQFIEVFKKYIDNIIKSGLIINNSTNTNIYIKCNCNNPNNLFVDLLKNLSEALQYILNDDITMHYNFIHDALYNWAEQLYDKMSWKINNNVL